MQQPYISVWSEIMSFKSDRLEIRSCLVKDKWLKGSMFYCFMCSVIDETSIKIYLSH